MKHSFYNEGNVSQSVCLDALQYFEDNHLTWLATLDVKPGWWAVISVDGTHEYTLRPTRAVAMAVGEDRYGTQPYLVAQIPVKSVVHEKHYEDARG